MITDRDITKLAAVFVTKDDLGRFATKDDINGLSVSMGRLETDIGDLKESVNHLEGHMIYLDGKVEQWGEDLKKVDEKLDGYIVSVDGIAGKYDALWIENGAGGLVLSRHTRKIEALAEVTGIKLPD